MNNSVIRHIKVDTQNLPEVKSKAEERSVVEKMVCVVLLSIFIVIIVRIYSF